MQAQSMLSACEKLSRTEQTLEKQAAELTRQSRRLLNSLDELSNPDTYELNADQFFK